MAVALKRIDLMLDEDLIEKLEEESRLQKLSVSDVVRVLLARDLGLPRKGTGFVERIRNLRKEIGPMPDSTPLIRESRDHG